MKQIFALAGLLLVWAAKVEAQGCFPGNLPTVAVTSVQALDPSQVPFAAVTMNVSASDGSKASKHMTVGAGTNLLFNWQSYRTSSVKLYWNTNNTGPHYWMTLSGSSGSLSWTANGNTGNTVYIYIVGAEQPGSGASNPTTQDGFYVTVTSQAPGVYLWDSIGTQMYAAITTTYSGMPQINFADCTQMRFAHHTPHATLQLQNSSGEIRNTASADGTTVPANTSVFATVTDYISVGPNDSITGSYGGSMFCDLEGANVWESLISFRIEYARVVVKDLGHAPRPGSEKPIPSVIYDVAPICDNNSDPPDWQPTVVHSWSSRHPYWWGVTSLFRAPDLSGVPWIPVASYLSDIDGFVSPSGGPWALAELIAIGGAVPYPANIGPDFPVPGACTQYPKNVLMTLGSADIPWWPWSN